MASPTDTIRPSAEGFLEKTPLAHVLLKAHDQRLSGTFELDTLQGRAATVLLREGQIAKARTRVDHYLVRVLLDSGILTEDQVDQWLPALMVCGELHGQVLVREGVITEDQLELGLRAQLVRQMRTVADLPPETRFRYYHGVDALAGYGGEAQDLLDPYPFIWANLLRQPPWAHVEAALERVGEAPFRLNADAEPTRFAFDKEQRALVELVRRRRWTVEDLAVARDVSPPVVRLIVYCLIIAKQVEIFPLVEEAEPVPVAPPAPPAPVVAVPEEPVGEPVVGRDSWLVPAPDPGSEDVTVAGAQLVDAPPPRLQLDQPFESVPPAEEEEAAPVTPARPEVSRAWAEEAARLTPSGEGPLSDAYRRMTPSVAINWTDLDAPPQPVGAGGPPAVDFSPFERPTFRPEDDRETPAAGNPIGRVAPRPARPVDPKAEVFTRSTVPRMHAVTPAEVAAYVAEQEKTSRAKTRPAMDLEDDPVITDAAAASRARTRPGGEEEPEPPAGDAQDEAPPSSLPADPPTRRVLLPAEPGAPKEPPLLAHRDLTSRKTIQFTVGQDLIEEALAPESTAHTPIVATELPAVPGEAAPDAPDKPAEGAPAAPASQRETLEVDSGWDE